MNQLEERALVDDLRRRGDHRVWVEGLSCSIDDYRAAARSVGRRNGWKIRTFLTADGQQVVVVWTDRETTDLELRAAMTTMNTGRPFDEVLEELRRANLSPVRDET